MPPDALAGAVWEVSEQYSSVNEDQDFVYFALQEGVGAALPPAPPTTVPLQPVQMPDLELDTLEETRELLLGAGVPKTAITEVSVGEHRVAEYPRDWLVIKQTPAAGEAWSPAARCA